MKKSDMTFSPYQLELLGDFYRSNFSVSRFAQEKGDCPHYILALGSYLRILILKYPLI